MAYIRGWSAVAGCGFWNVSISEQRPLPEFIEFHPTVFFGVPTIYVRLLDLDHETAGRMGTYIRLFVSGSAPLPAEVLRDFEKRYGHTILERYGMSETLMNLSNPYHAAERRPRENGRGYPLPGVSVRLLDPAGEPVAEGEAGEIYLRGPNIFPGYWRREESNASSVQGWVFPDR